MITVKTTQLSTTVWEITRNGANGRTAKVTFEPTTEAYTLHDYETGSEHTFGSMREARKFFLNY